MRELDLFRDQTSLTEKTIDDLLICNPSPESVRSVLEEYCLCFSGRSIENIAHALQIFKEIRVDIPFSLIVYGSTARGTAGMNPKVQEFQFWDKDLFYGSAFRAFGLSDLDLRCVSLEPQEVIACLEPCKDLPIFVRNPVGIRVDNLSYAREEIADILMPSFYRRILLLNNPIVLGGGDLITSLVESGRPCLSLHDFAYEREFHESKDLLRSVFQKNEAIYIPEEKLFRRFPEFYNPRNLALTNIQRGKSFKILFGERESSLIAVPISDVEDIKNFMSMLSQHPGASYHDLKNLLEKKLK